jgi:hypothetical protein
MSPGKSSHPGRARLRQFGGCRARAGEPGFPHAETETRRCSCSSPRFPRLRVRQFVSGVHRGMGRAVPRKGRSRQGPACTLSIWQPSSAAQTATASSGDVSHLQASPPFDGSAIDVLPFESSFDCRDTADSRVVHPMTQLRTSRIGLWVSIFKKTDQLLSSARIGDGETFIRSPKRTRAARGEPPSSADHPRWGTAIPIRRFPALSTQHSALST